MGPGGSLGPSIVRTLHQTVYDQQLDFVQKKEMVEDLDGVLLDFGVWLLV